MPPTRYRDLAIAREMLWSADFNVQERLTPSVVIVQLSRKSEVENQNRGDQQSTNWLSKAPWSEIDCFRIDLDIGFAAFHKRSQNQLQNDQPDKDSPHEVVA